MRLLDPKIFPQFKAISIVAVFFSIWSCRLFKSFIVRTSIFPFVLELFFDCICLVSTYQSVNHHGLTFLSVKDGEGGYFLGGTQQMFNLRIDPPNLSGIHALRPKKVGPIFFRFLSWEIERKSERISYWERRIGREREKGRSKVHFIRIMAEAWNGSLPVHAWSLRE